MLIESTKQQDYRLTDFKSIKIWAMKLFKRAKKIERIEKLETKELIRLVREASSQDPENYNHLTEDLRLQEEIDKETLTLERLFKRAIAFFKISESGKMGGYIEIYRGRFYLYQLFNGIMKIIKEELAQVDKEIQALTSELQKA